jgi:MoaA/NifB/PqqE/SkfB family radical SAM enzyme
MVKTYNYFIRSLPKTLKALVGFRVPLRVSHYITYRCNLECRYCARNKSCGGELTTNEVKTLMSGFRKAGTLFWGFNGGEALLRDDIGELIDHGKNLGMFVNILTNGTLLAPKCREIRNVDMVNISFEGPKAVHDQMRAHSFDSMCNGIEAIRRKGIKFTLTTCMNSKNLDSLGFILDFAHRYKTNVSFQPIRVQKEDVENISRDFFPTRERMHQGIDYLLREKKKGAPVATSTTYLRQVRRLWPDGQHGTPCWAGRIYCSITPEGCISACCDTLSETSKNGSRRSPEKAVEEFYRLPKFQCSTCFASIPLEANLAMSACLRNPFRAAVQMADFIPRHFWRAQR